MMRSALPRHAARAARLPRARHAETLRRLLPRREAVRRGLRRASGVALVSLLVFAQTPATPRVLAGLAPRWPSGASRLFLSGGLAEGVRRLVWPGRSEPTARRDAGLPPPVLDTSKEITVGEKLTAAAPRASLSASRAGLAAPAPLLAAPTNLAVSQTAAAQINLSWTPSAGAHHYRVERADRINGAVAFLADTTENVFQDTTVSGGTTARAYLYRVLAVDHAGNSSQPSTLALGTAVTFADDPLVARETVIKAQHLTELRQAVNAVRRAADLPDASWAEATITPRVTRVKASHVQELRDRLNEALEALGIPTPAFTEAALATGAAGTTIKKIHFDELRRRSTRGSSGVSGGVSVALTSPSNNALVGDGANVQLTAAVSGGGIAKVEFFRGQTKLGEDTTAPYGFVWANAPEGGYSLTAVATDGFGAQTTSPAVGLSVVNFPLARLDPANRTGAGGVDMVSRNFNWTLPLVGLPGRSGLDLGLALSYNSLVWTKSAAHVLFDGDAGFPAPGFRLGFPAVQQKFYNTRAGKWAYMLVAPGGSRVELRQSPTPNTYEAVDSSYLLLTEDADGGLTVRTTEGTKMSYRYLGGAFRCAGIKDRNGNFIAVAHDDFGNVSAITDTLARALTFAYDGGRLQSVTQTWRRETAAGATVTETREWARFYYEDKTIQTNFDGLTPLGAQTGQTFRALTKVKLDDGSSFTFNYTTWGQVNQIARYAADNRLLNYVSYNLPADTAAPQADCPRFTEQRVWAAFWNGDDDGVPDTDEEAALVYSAYDFAAGVASATTPDGTLHKEFYETSGWRKGLTTKTETFSADDLEDPRKWTTLEWTQDDTGLAFPLNPRVEETHVHDSGGNHRRTRVEYAPYGLPRDVYEYDSDAATVLRRTHVSYLAVSVTPGGAYFNRRLVGLPEETTVYGGAGTQERLASKVTVEYDLSGEYLEAVAAGTTGHDGAAYGAGFLARGNACRVKRWDADAPADATKTVKAETGYNTAGSVIFSRDALGRKTVVGYADSDGGATLAYPTKVTDADNFFSTREYNYDLGLLTLATDPKGATRKTLFDARGRAERVTSGPGGTYTRWEYPSSGRLVRQFTLADAGLGETSATTIFDGAGRVRATLNKLPGGHAAQRFVFDAMGRQTQQSNPIAVTVDETDLSDVSSWEPAGDDNPDEDGTGWVFTTQTFDWQGRPLTVTNPGSPATTKEFSYGGCGCAGGQVVLTRDEVGRRRKVFFDVLGRVSKTQDLTVQAKTAALTSAADGGDVYRTAVTLYNARDQVVETLSHAGHAPPTDQTKIQKTTLEYDGHGRLKSRHLPRQSAGKATTFEYHADDTLWKVTDARGALATHAYNNRRLLTSVAYTAPAGVPDTPDVIYEYDAAGNRTRMTDGQGWASYTLNELSQVVSETRHFSAINRSFTLSYTYTSAGALKSVTDETFDTTVNYARDDAGRLTGVTGTGYPQVTEFASAIEYRAWGAPKGLTYGNGLRFTATYTARLQVLRAELKSASNSMVMGAENQYYDDGRLRFSTDLRPVDGPNFDRKFEYDGVGRLKEAYSGAEARGETVNREYVPLRQTYGYNEFDNLTSRGNWHWERFKSFTDTYVNDRRQTPTGQTPWEYDDDGNLLYDLKRRYKVDAAGRIVESSKDGLTVTQGYDGDGRPVSHTEAVTAPASTTYSYNVRSTPLGGEVVAEVTETGAHRRGFVHAAGGVLARSEGGAVFWEHRQPATGGRWESSVAWAPQALTELDPLGAGVGAESPYEPGVTPAEPVVFDAGSHWGSRAGSPSDPRGGCAVNGMEMPCEVFLRMADDGVLALRVNDPRGPGQMELPLSGWGLGPVWVDTSEQLRPRSDLTIHVAEEIVPVGTDPRRSGFFFFLPVGVAAADPQNHIRNSDINYVSSSTLHRDAILDAITSIANDERCRKAFEKYGVKNPYDIVRSGYKIAQRSDLYRPDASKVLGLSNEAIEADKEVFDREENLFNPEYTADLTHKGVIIFNQTQITQKRFHSVRAVVIHAFIHAGGIPGKGTGDWGDLTYFDGYTFIQASCGGSHEFFKTRTK